MRNTHNSCSCTIYVRVPGGKEAHIYMAKLLMLSGVVVGECDDTRALRHIPNCPPLSTSSNVNQPHVCKSVQWDLKVYLVDDSLDQETMNLMDQVYKSTFGDIQQMVLGDQLKPANVGSSGMKWYLASYSNVSGKVCLLAELNKESECKIILYHSNFLKWRLYFIVDMLSLMCILNALFIFFSIAAVNMLTSCNCIKFNISIIKIPFRYLSNINERVELLRVRVIYSLNT